VPHCQAAEALQLGRHLLRTAEDMAVVLHELPQPEQAVQRAAGLLAVHDPKLRQAQRQIAVRA